jgi:hypothetical protein
MIKMLKGVELRSMGEPISIVKMNKVAGARDLNQVARTFGLKVKL